MFTKSTSDAGSQRDQHGDTKTIPDETKEAYGRPRADHDALDTGKGQGSLRDRVDAAVSETSDVPAARKADNRTEQGFTVGERADHHDLAARKQP